MRCTSVCVSAAIATFGIATISVAADDAVFYNGRGNAYMYKHDYDRAIADFEQAIRLDPQFAKAYNGRGATYFRKGDYDRAMSDYNRAIRLDSKYAVTYVNRGYLYEKKRDYRRAIADYNQAVKLDPNNAIAREKRERLQALLVANRPSNDGVRNDSPKLDSVDLRYLVQVLREQLYGCWNRPAGVSGTGGDAPSAIVRFKLKQDGSLASEPVVVGSHADPSQAVAKTALAAVKQCQPLKLPPNLYEFWKEVEVDFVANAPI